MIKITSDLGEFREREHYHEWIEPWTFGVYKGNTIWYRYRPKPLSVTLTILHEIIHLIIDKSLSVNHATLCLSTLCLFRDFLDGTLDFINGILRYREWRVSIHANLQYYVKANFRHWWTWVRCK